MQDIFTAHPAFKSEQAQESAAFQPGSADRSTSYTPAHPKPGTKSSAIAKRFIFGQPKMLPTQTLPTQKPPSKMPVWCTGKDSNLRTSLGGTDLQSVGFNHSPTCAQPPGDAALALHPADNFMRHARQRTNSLAAHSWPLPALTDEPMQNRLLPIRETKIRAYGMTTRRSLHAGIVPNGVCWKNLLRPTESCRCRNFVSWFLDAGAGEGI